MTIVIIIIAIIILIFKNLKTIQKKLKKISKFSIEFKLNSNTQHFQLNLNLIFQKYLIFQNSKIFSTKFKMIFEIFAAVYRYLLLVKDCRKTYHFFVVYMKMSIAIWQLSRQGRVEQLSSQLWTPSWHQVIYN